MEWLAHVESTLKLRLPQDSSVCIALSGGLDSVVLLDIFHRLASPNGWQLSALHVHHGLSPNADDWADFCRQLCAAYALPLTIEQVDVAPLRALGTEAAARQLRQAAFARQPCDVIALAHHADDQAETVLLQLLRGAGSKGLAAMPEYKPAGSAAPAQIRPLLTTPRPQLRAYAEQRQLVWVEDESNADEHYRRNFLRRQILPQLSGHFPAYRQTLARSAQHLAETEMLLAELAQQDGLTPSPEQGGLPLANLRALPPLRAKNLLRHFLHHQGAPLPSSARLDELLRQLCSARADAAVCIRVGNWQVRRFRDAVYALPALPPFDPARILPWRGETELNWPALACRLIFSPAQSGGISLAKLKAETVSLRFRLPPFAQKSVAGKSCAPLAA